MTGRLFLQYPPAELSQFLWVSHDSADIGVVVILPSGEGFCFAAYPKIELPEVSRIVRRMLSCSAPAFHWHLGQPGVTACQKSFCAETQNPSESYNRQRVLFCHFSPPRKTHLKMPEAVSAYTLLDYTQRRMLEVDFFLKQCLHCHICLTVN